MTKVEGRNATTVIGADDPDNPEWTAEEFASARRGTAHLPPAMQAAIEQERRGRGPQKKPTKELVSIRLSRETLAAYRRLGKGWQGRVDHDLAMMAARLTSPKPSRDLPDVVSRSIGQSRKTTRMGLKVDMTTGTGSAPRKVATKKRR